MLDFRSCWIVIIHVVRGRFLFTVTSWWVLIESISGVSATLRIGCGLIHRNSIRRRRSFCGARPVGASTDVQPLHWEWQSVRRPSLRCPPCARPGHICRLRPGDAHSRVSDAVKLLQYCINFAVFAISCREPPSSRCVGPLSARLWQWHGRPYPPTSWCRTQRVDWYSVSVDLTTSWMHSSASIGCECLKGLMYFQDRRAD